MIYLVFKNTPDFHDGLNISIRRGADWMKADLGTELNIARTGDKTVIDTAELVGKAVMVFDLIPEEIFRYAGCDLGAAVIREMGRSFTAEDMEPSSENGESFDVVKNDMLQFLHSVYEDFNPSETVTILFFIINK